MTIPPRDPDIGYYGEPPRRRPTAVTVASIIVIVFSALGLFSPCVAIPLFVDMGQPDPTIEAMKNDPAIFTWTLVGAGLGFVLAIIGLTGAIGALTLRSWGRTLLLFYAIIGLLNAAAGWVLQFTIFAGRIPPPADQTQQLIQFILQIVGVIIGIGVPLMVLIVFTRPKVKEAFEVRN